MIKQTLTASTDPTPAVRGPLSGEGTFAMKASVPADGLQLQGSIGDDPGGDWYDLTDVVLTATLTSVNFKTDFPHLRAKPVTGAVTAEEILISGQE